MAYFDGTEHQLIKQVSCTASIYCKCYEILVDLWCIIMLSSCQKAPKKKIRIHTYCCFVYFCECEHTVRQGYLAGFFKFSEEISPLCGATDTSDLDFWWHLPWVSKPGWIPSLAFILTCVQWIPQIHLWCNTCWLLGCQHGSWPHSLHACCRGRMQGFDRETFPHTLYAGDN